MLNIETLATILLLGRMVSVGFIIAVIVMQVRLFRLPVDPEVRTFRRVLFVLSFLILCSNFAPIAIDLLTIFTETNRPAYVPAISITYALSNSFTAALMSITLWTLYFIAQRKRIPTRNATMQL